MNAKVACYIFAVAFIGAGILGYIPNPIVSPDGIFAVNGMHNIVHILTGVLFLIGAGALNQSRWTLMFIGVIYFLVALAGFFASTDGMLMGIRINGPDNVLHLVFAVVLVLAGLVLPGAPKPQYLGGGNLKNP